ncbi:MULTISPECIES: head-tail adaptor protein [Staphylococcus]|uniref:head-tail adaptor protein n=1 Tax=Staphylococcus TaxID=1279 RepID=UPI001D00E282|nr:MULTISPECIES: head-tail adaptor protein [Staphylococcus]MDK1673734.1 head-tail adaptor protein [Staphylococcus saprophyticus]MDW4051422.1 head-tail adaptor protein [Staphylococcus saprophyticus]
MIPYTVAKPWSDIKTLRGDEFVTLSGLVANKNPIRFIVRYREGIKHHFKVKYQDKE